MLTQQGYGVIAEGVSKYPEFNLFCQPWVRASR